MSTDTTTTPGKPGPSWPRRHKVLTAILLLAALIVVIVAVSAATAKHTPSHPVATGTPSPTPRPSPALNSAQLKFVSDMRSQFGFKGTSAQAIAAIASQVCNERLSGASQAATTKDVVSDNGLTGGGSAGYGPVIRLAETDLCPAQLPPPQTYIIATFSGSSDTNTPQFTITANDSGNWVMKYTYNCAGQIGGTGNFIVNEDGGNDPTGSSSAVSLNNLDAGQTSSTNVYDDAGTHYLQIETECPYTITVEQTY